MSMAASAALSSEQMLRLMKLVEAVASRCGLDCERAIGFLEEAAAAGLGRPSYRSATQFAAGMRAISVRRNEAFGMPVFRDPAWDMLLDLMVATDEERPVSVSGLCHAAGVPTTTALRHLDRLEELGLIARAPDPCDKRRFWLEAKPETLTRVREIVARLQAEA
jgi:hypothetical protein